MAVRDVKRDVTDRATPGVARWLGLGGAALSLAWLAACSDGQTQTAGKAPPPAEVGVVTVKLQTVPMVAELPGRLEASRVAQVRARVAGVVHKRVFTEGSDVKAGQVLYQIDAGTYQAALESARAAQAKAEANLSQASALVERYQPLQAAKAISPQEFLNAQVAQRQAQADVAAAKAAVKNAQINLGYTTVTAPISGRVGRALVTEGALVGQGEATPLALVQQINPLYVNFTQPASEALKLQRALSAGQLRQAAGGAASVRVLLDDGSEYPVRGRLLFTDLSVDSTSGQVALRAEIPNPQAALLPGLYVRVRLEQAQVEGGALVPQQSVTRSATADTVMVVDAQGNVTPRPVKLGGALGNQWVVLSGLKEGEQVMADGFQKLRPKTPVKAVPWQPQAPQAAASTASAR
ncbi:MAG TPA: efflux RND transporter periplasmic adaptor subunit [Aquabacterium sp.]|uniref:efflux RND transporter periplasmic adaptor subunit n=1 Tax=Aquabacterium sp. TaxID=1872578 RepID=UPI002E365122|nr:efflux RND transporter periplasmic adaptor subunit [Aquabacterium sp.]HEX5373996.1 efflux RND transporter periplasmic adaptor subunit [Aquabacterium sp.]